MENYNPVLEPSLLVNILTLRYDPSIKSNLPKKIWKDYISDPNNPKWLEIAENGRNYTMSNLTNDVAADSLVELFKEFVF